MSVSCGITQSKTESEEILRILKNETQIEFVYYNAPSNVDFFTVCKQLHKWLVQQAVVSHTLTEFWL